MIKINLMTQDDLIDLNMKYDSKLSLERGKLVFVIHEDDKLSGYSISKADKNKAYIEKYISELKTDQENLFALKSIAGILTRYEITEIYNNTERIDKFFKNDGKLDLENLFRSTCNDI